MATQHQLLNRDEKQSISNCFSLEENTQNSFQKRVKCFQERKNSFQKTISQIGFLIMCLIPLLSVSQEIKWAKSCSADDIYQSCFDSQGNLYLIGSAYKFAAIDSTKIFPDNITAKKGMFIGKFDTVGKLQWLKSIQSQGRDIEYCSMQLLGDTSLIFTAPIRMPNFFEYTFFLDTIIQGNMTEFPFNLGNMSVFVKLSTDEGALEDVHVLKCDELRVDGTTPGVTTPIASYNGPIGVDNSGNIYFFFNYYLNYTTENDIGLFIYIDGKDTIYAGDAHNGYSKILKLSKDFEFIWIKDVIVDASSIEDMIYPKLLHITKDDEDNMYLTGYIQRGMPLVDNYKRYIDVGNGNNIIINNPNGKKGLCYIPFVIKYDTSGTSLWCNQIYSGTPPAKYPAQMPATYKFSCIDSNYLYVLGDLPSIPEVNNDFLYFDSLFIHKYNTPHTVGRIFVKYDKVSGEYVSHGNFSTTIPNSTNVYSLPTLAIINGNVITQIFNLPNAYVENLDTTIENTQGNLVMWNGDGDIVYWKQKKSDIAGTTTYNSANEELLLTGTYSKNLDLGDTILSTSKGNTYMIMLKDSSFLNHYTVIRDTICDSADWKGNHITWKGDYYDTLQAADGYDSIIIYRVQVRHSFKEETSVEINEGETYDFHGQILSSAGTYYDSLQTINGCDSVYILNLSVKSGLEDISGYVNIESVELAPNPAKDEVVITYTIKENTSATFVLYNSEGKELITKQLAGKGKQSVSLNNCPAGTYYYKVYTNEKVIKTDIFFILR